MKTSRIVSMQLLTGIIAVVANGHFCSIVSAQVNDNFDSYSDTTQLLNQWVKIGTGVGGAELINAGNNPWAFPDIQGNAAQYDGATGVGANTAYKWNTPFTMTPSATQAVKLSFDQYVPGTGTGNANWKSTVGLRGPGAENLIELGITNSVPAAPDFVPYSFRLVNLFPSAQNANFAMTSGGYGALTLPVTKNTPKDDEIGGGWHHYTATITPTDITFTIDLYRDGLQNDDVDTVPGVGVPGVDATTVIAPEGGLTISANGFTDIRFGMLSASGSSTTVTAFDNIKLEYVPIEPGPGEDDADFDGDGDVDGADFLTWQRGLIDDGTAQLADGDANGDGDVDNLDLDVWKLQAAGAATPNAAAVPEPATYGLALLALAGAAAIRRRR